MLPQRERSRRRKSLRISVTAQYGMKKRTLTPHDWAFVLISHQINVAMKFKKRWLRC